MPSSPVDALEGVYKRVLVGAVREYIPIPPRFACVEAQDQDLTRRR